MPLPLPLRLQSQSQEWDSRGASYRRQSEKRRNLRCIGAVFLSTLIQGSTLEWVRPGLMSFRERLGVALCRANKESVCAFVCRDIFIESVTRKKMISIYLIFIRYLQLTFRNKSMNSYQPGKLLQSLSLQPIRSFNRSRYLGHRCQKPVSQS